MEGLPSEEYIDLVPERFLEDEEAYLRMYGRQSYHRLVSMVTFEMECMIPLKDGSRWHFYDFIYKYEPLDLRAVCN